jgi:hypothetical protein
MEANLNRKANGWRWMDLSVGLYVPLLEFNQYPIARDRHDKVFQANIVMKF